MNYYTADCHFGHANIVESGMGRTEFNDIGEHDAALLDAINTVVGKHDILHILGDFAWKDPAKYRRLLFCRHIIFVIGNHDKPAASLSTFGTCHQIRVTKFSDGQKVVLCHYPIAFWPSSHRDAYHLYGHMHTRGEARLDAAFPNRRSMDVGVDSAKHLLGAYRPFSEVEVLGLLAGRTGHDPLSLYTEERDERIH